MSKVFIEESTLTAIGDSIRDKTGKQDLISPLNMPTEIESIKGGNIIKTVSGTCPIALNDCVEGNLLDYKIYGAEGGVGNQSKNLFDVNAYGDVSKWAAVSYRYVEIYVGTGKTVTVSHKTNYGTGKGFYMVIGYDLEHKGVASGAWIYHSTSESLCKTSVTVTTTGDYIYINVGGSNTESINAMLADEFMVEISPTKTEYVLGGNVVPLKINDTAYTINIGVNQLGINDYLDFENRVLVKDGVSSYMDLPEIPLIEGTNTFNVETTVQPSNVSVTYVKSIDFNTMKTVEGTLPLTVEGVGQRLEDYKIYGADGGVGDKTKNLYTGKFNVEKVPFDEPIPAGTPISISASAKGYDANDPTKRVRIRFWATDGTQLANIYPYLDSTGTRIKYENLSYAKDIATYWVSVLDAEEIQIEIGSTYTEYEPYGYKIPVKVNDNITKIYTKEQLGLDDYIDFENRSAVINGVETHIDFPEIYLQNGQNIIDVDTTVKPSKMSVSFVDDLFDPSHIITKSTEISCENTGTLYNSACEQVIKSPHITNPTGTHLYHWNQLNDNGYISKSVTQNGITFTNVGNGKLVLSGTTTNRALIPVVSSSFMSTWDTTHKYYLRKLHPVSSNTTIYWHTYHKLVVSGIFLGSEMNFAANYPRVSVAPNYDATGIEITPQIFDLTAMFGEGNEPTMEQFDAMFPESYYPFNAGVDIYNLPITINGIVNDIVCADNGTEYIPKDKIIIPEGDADISLQGTLSGTYLQTVSA